VARAAVSAANSAGAGSRPRFAQLTYASVDRAGAPGGWQVQDTTGGVDPAEREFLVGRISTRFSPAATVPPYLAADEVRALPRRLVYTSGPGGSAGYWHTAPCGADAHGRPGNIFVHVLLDRMARDGGAARPLRPSDLLRSPHWLRPFGRDGVAGTVLGAVPEPPWDPDPGRVEVLAFLFRLPASDVGVLCVLFDAVYAAMAGGPQVVFGVRTEEAALSWIAVLSHLMSPGAARRFHWSTSERLAERPSWPAGVHLVVTPHDDVAGAGPVDGLVLLGDGEPVRRTDLGRGPRVTRSGSSVAVTAWSVMAYEVSARPDRAEAVLVALDRVAAEVGDTGLDPAWPMAMVVATRPDELPDAVAVARSVLETRSPDDLPTHHPELYAHVLALAERDIEPTAGDAWAALRASPTDARRAVLRDVYLLRALADEQWLSSPGDPGTDAALLSHPRPVPPAVRERSVALLRSLHSRARDGVDDSARVALATVVVRLTDILRVVRLDLGPDDTTRLSELWTWVTDQVVLAPGHREDLLAVLDGRVGPGARDALTETITRHLDPDRSRVGTRVPLAVLAVLAVRLPRPAELARTRSPQPLQRELAACLTLVDPDPWSLAWLVRVWDLLGSAEDPAGSAELLRGAEPARPGHLAVLLNHERSAPVRDLARRTLLSSRPGAETDDLVDAVLGADPDGVDHSGGGHGDGEPTSDPLRAAAELRRAADLIDTTSAGRVRLLTLVRWLLGSVDPGDVAPSIWRAVLAAHAAEMLHQSWKGAPETADEQLPPSVERALRTQAAGADGAWRCAHVLAGCRDVPGAALVHAGLCLRSLTEDRPEEWNRLGRLAAIVATGPATWSALDRAAWLRHRAGNLAESDRDEGLRRFRHDLRVPERSLARRLFVDRDEQTDAACRAWWADVTSTGPDDPDTIGSATGRGGH